MGDGVFVVGTAALTYFMLGLRLGWSYEQGPARVADLESARVPGTVLP